MKRLVIAITLVLAGSALDSRAQNPGGATAPGKPSGEAGLGGGLGHGQRQSKSPDAVAQELMNKFDADGDGELSQEELTQALESLGEHHSHAGSRGGRRGRSFTRPQGGSGTQGNADAFGTSGSQASSGSQGSSATHATSGAQGSSGAQSEDQDRPSADEIATHLIEKYAANKKGLKLEELALAIKEHREKQAQSGGQTVGQNAGQ